MLQKNCSAPFFSFWMNPYPVICRLPESKGMWAFFWTNEDKKGRIVGKKIAGFVYRPEKRGVVYMERKNVWLSYGEEQLQELEEVSARYKACLDAGKTERECVRVAVDMAEKAGYRNLQELMEKKEPLKPQDRVYLCYMDKSIVLYQLGEKPLEQ